MNKLDSTILLFQTKHVMFSIILSCCTRILQKKTNARLKIFKKISAVYDFYHEVLVNKTGNEFFLRAKVGATGNHRVLRCEQHDNINDKRLLKVWRLVVELACFARREWFQRALTHHSNTTSVRYTAYNFCNGFGRL